MWPFIKFSNMSEKSQQKKMSAAAISYRVEERVGSALDVAPYKTLVGISCIKDGYGVEASHVRDRLRVLRTAAKRLYYGEREIRSIFLLYLPSINFPVWSKLLLLQRLLWSWLFI